VQRDVLKPVVENENLKKVKHLNLSNLPRTSLSRAGS